MGAMPAIGVIQPMRVSRVIVMVSVCFSSECIETMDLVENIDPSEVASVAVSPIFRYLDCLGGVFAHSDDLVFGDRYQL